MAMRNQYLRKTGWKIGITSEGSVRALKSWSFTRIRYQLPRNLKEVQYFMILVIDHKFTSMLQCLTHDR